MVRVEPESFMRDTIAMPGLRDVYAGEKMTSWIYLPTFLIKGQVDAFHVSYERLHLISKSIGVLTVLYAPESRDGKYRLMVTRCRHLNNGLCTEYGAPVVDDTCKKCPTMGIA